MNCLAAWVLAAATIFNVTVSIYLVRAQRPDDGREQRRDGIDDADSFRHPIRRSPAEVI